MTKLYLHGWATNRVSRFNDMAGKFKLRTHPKIVEFRRVFSPIEVFGVGFSIIGLLPSMAYVCTMFYPLYPRFDGGMRAVLSSYSLFRMEGQ